MARPKKRSASSGGSNRSTPAGQAGPQASSATSAATESSTATDAPARRSDSVDWNSEYSYVIGDLKQMAVVTFGLFAVMIVIGFII